MTTTTEDAPVASVRQIATLKVRYPRRRGRIALRGDTTPLTWTESLAPVRLEDDGDTSVFELPVASYCTIEAKPIRSDGTWAKGRNLVVAGGDDCIVIPSFEVEKGILEPWQSVPTGSTTLDVRVYLPPSYNEHDHTRYPVVYAQDGQALWSDEADPFGVWSLDRVLDELFLLGSMDEVIVVSIRTSEKRAHILSPVPDKHHQGGGGPEHLAAIVDHLKPWVDRHYRTLPDRNDTALLGSSMGGLFSFYAAWTRPDVFGKAMCLSASFWWASRWTVKLVQGGTCPAPRPWYYLDSGVAVNPFQKDANQQDGFQHTQAVIRALIAHCYGRGDDLYTLSFPGQSHEPAAWSARAAIPLQLMFPRRA